MVTILVLLTFAVMLLASAMWLMGQFAQLRLKALSQQDQHARAFFKLSKDMIDRGCLSDSQTERLVFLGREIADSEAAYRFYVALQKDSRPNDSNARARQEELEELAKSPDNLRAYAEALQEAFLAISYSSWFWGLPLRAKMAEDFNDAPRMTRATKKVAKQVGNLELQPA